MKFLILCAAFMIGSLTHAEDKTCTVEGPHCKGCAEMIDGQLCDDKYTTCKIDIVDGKKKVAKIHLVTKDADAKIDEKALGEQLLKMDPEHILKKCEGAKKTKKT